MELEETAESHLVNLSCVMGRHSFVRSASFFIQLDEEVSRSHLDALGSKLIKFFEESVKNESVCNESVYAESVYNILIYFMIVVEGRSCWAKLMTRLRCFYE